MDKYNRLGKREVKKRLRFIKKRLEKACKAEIIGIIFALAFERKQNE
jgi:hypothetical protein